jgi:hypothetical protein
MNQVYSNDELYRISSVLKPEMKDGVIYIDDFYENAEDIYDMITSRPYPLWKYNAEEGNTRNGVDYYDCRIVDKNGHPTREYFNEHNRILDICRRYWWKGDYEWDMIYEFNCFKPIKEMTNELQHYPHIDSQLGTPDEASVLNFLVYMDKVEDGGTAVYGGEWITNDENINLLYPVEERFKLEKVIEHKFNRAVIFPGNCMHGAYINDYSKYKDDWRFTQVTFYKPRR